MARFARAEPGDVFCVDLKGEFGFFQFLMLDISQLNSEVIRVFSGRYSTCNIDLLEAVRDSVQFYSHVDIRLGRQLGYWDFVGKVELEHDFEGPCFRQSDDIGNPEIKVSDRWWVWRAGKDFKYVGALNDVEKLYDIGSVKPPKEIVTRMKTGKYSYFYPGFK